VRFIDALDHTAAIMSAVSYVETHLVILGRRTDVNPTEIELAIRDLGIEVVDVTRDQTGAAIGAFVKYGKGRHRAQLNFGDCFSYALAKSRGLPLLYKGDDFVATDIVPALTI
jgi:ribonuclease VapC